MRSCRPPPGRPLKGPCQRRRGSCAKPYRKPLTDHLIEESETPLIGRWGPMKPQSLDEEARATPQKRKRKRTPKRPLSDKQREHLLSEKHIEHLREMNRKRAEAGKRVTPHIGSVHGWGGSKRKELVRIRAEASRKADIIMKRLEDEGVVEATLAAVVAEDGTIN